MATLHMYTFVNLDSPENPENLRRESDARVARDQRDHAGAYAIARACYENGSWLSLMSARDRQVVAAADSALARRAAGIVE